MQKFGTINPSECVGKFAIVGQRGSERQKGKFSVVHDTQKEAEEECARLASQLISEEGQDCRHVFFVLEVKSCMGMRGRKLVSIPSV